MKIIFDCVCGNTHELDLNPERKLYTIGSYEPTNSLNLCRDDLRALSRVQCHIRYVNNSWVIFDGCPSEIPLPVGKLSPKSACGTFVRRKGKIIEVSHDKGLELQVGDEICFVPSQIPVLYQGQEVIPRGGFIYTGLVAESLIAAEDVDKLIEKLQKENQLTKIEPAPKLVRQKFSELYELTKQITNQISDTKEALDTILSFIFEKIPATRAAGIILLQPDGTLKTFVGREGFKPDFTFSTTVAKMAIDSKKPVVSHNISEMIQFKDFIARQQEEYFNTGKIAPEIPSFGQSITTLSIESVIVVPLFEGENIIGLLWLDNRKGNKAFTETDFYLSVAISSLIQLQLLYDRHKSIALLQSNMERFFSPKTLEWLKKRTSVGKEVKLSVRECDVSILYVDIVDSTRLAKELTPRAFFEHLTPHYYETMSEAIFAFDGHVDDFMGDGIMAIFGDVLGIDEKKEIPKAKYAINAVSAALRMVNHWPIIVKEKHLPEVMKIRIGIHSGRAVVGSVGYEKRMEFTALGKDVNIASRLEKFAEPNGIVISDQTYQLVKDKFQCEDLGEKEIKGITEGETGKLRLWKVVGEKK